jgi:hypothetical protein
MQADLLHASPGARHLSQAGDMHVVVHTYRHFPFMVVVLPHTTAQRLLATIATLTINQNKFVNNFLTAKLILEV